MFSLVCKPSCHPAVPAIHGSYALHTWPSFQLLAALHVASGAGCSVRGQLCWQNWGGPAGQSQQQEQQRSDGVLNESWRLRVGDSAVSQQS